MPVEEKYDKMMDALITLYVQTYAFNKEHGIVKKWLDHYVQAQNKMMSRYMSPVVKLYKTFPSNKTFKQVVNQFMYVFQIEQPLSNLELSWKSDFKVAIRVKDCHFLKRSREILNKIGFNINPKEICELKNRADAYLKHMSKKMGIKVFHSHEENGCIWTIMNSKMTKDHALSLELDIAKMKETDDRLLIDGFLGELEEISFVNESMLEIRGVEGTLRIELNKKDLRKLLLESDEL